MTFLWEGPTRVYFNAYEEAPLFWSVDDGEMKNEVKCSAVKFVIGAGGLETVVSPTNWQPKAWLFAVKATVYLQGDEVVVIG